MFGSLGLPELLVLLLLVVLLFGYKRMGQLGRGLGEGIRNFKDSIRSEPKDTPDEGDEAGTRIDPS
jgi:sec-independent protein translocase protein TatA